MPHLPFPHSSQVEGELRELRCHYGRQLYRILYRRSDQLVVLLHIFAKRSAKIDRRDIRTAQDRGEDFKARMEARPRTPPRAAGRDAP
jgi:phage-related protein